MRIKSLLLLLGILGSSSLALADRFETRRDRFCDRDDWSHRYDRLEYRNDYRSDDRNDYRRTDVRRHTSWVPLTSLEQLDGRGDVFDIDSRDRFIRLRLQNQTGRMAVRAIIVEFGNGERQRFDVNRRLSGNHDMVNIELPGNGSRRIASVIVLGDSHRNGTYQLYAM